MDEAEKGLENQVYSVLERIRVKGGVIRKGVNEVTKALERGQAKLVVVAADVSPKEIVMHLPLLSKDKNVPYISVGSRQQLGNVIGINVGTSAVAVIDAGEEDHSLQELIKKITK
ncbi:MAG: ribosomal L7Ae/L30e/S12e/Gadd45 family protein [Candidatus Parvarchaeota archaeon]|nr:ribosomal L7Ae/L30e/S12e/Gadd45 family protein [Candidatus Parvarchaeota archaeon]MCW1301869.1 ribosomal L7Ae/L30e/S12e/Gadd45 family protein [Candidatus Parvarchaeota archaeon]